MASDVTMSSEGSSTSRLRQFGLYKTIDSQTAEFLKLSRKRQIRRGCACAAVSTAITVTVVVCALLIYEYGFRRDFKMVSSNLRKLNWIKTVNDSNATFVKKTPINKNNGKLIATILKALDQKRYLETLVEEHSSPAHDRTTDYPFKKNVFADRNRKTSSKMYEGYKPTSQELFKTRRKDNFAKTRKLMDYQRVMTYLNTMSLNKRYGKSIHTDVSSTSESYFTEYHENDVLNDSKHQPAKAKWKDTRKKNHKRYCACPPRSNLTNILEKLYNSIQNLRPKAIERTASNTKKGDWPKPKTNNTVIVRKSKHCCNNQRATISTKNIQHTNIPPRLNTATVTQSPGATMKNNSNSRNIQNEITTNRNDYNTVKYKNNNNNSYAGEKMPWKLDFGIAHDEANSIYKQIGIEPANNPTIGKMKEIDAIANSPHYSHSDEQDDFDDKFYNTQPEPNQYLDALANKAKTHENKRKTTEEISSIANRVNEISKKVEKTTMVNEPKTPPSVEYPTVKRLHTKLLPFEIVDLVKNASTYIVQPIEKKEKQNISHLGTNPNDTAVERISLGSLKKQNDGIQSVKPLLQLGTNPNEATVDRIISGSLKKQKEGIQSVKPLILTAKKADDKIPLVPMIKSYLLSKKDNGILNLGAESTLRRIELQTMDSEELPFDLQFVSNEEDGQFNVQNDLHTVKGTTSTAQLCDKNNDKSQAKNCRERLVISKAGKKEKILSLSQIWEPMYLESVSRKPPTFLPKSSTEAPRNLGHKKPKIKEIFYMTGGETPVEDFDANLRALMYYDKSPVNYTALANSYLNKIESNSIELPQSMLPESRPSPLQIRRHHEKVVYTTNLYTSDEQI